MVVVVVGGIMILSGDVLVGVVRNRGGEIWERKLRCVCSGVGWGGVGYVCMKEGGSGLRETS